jgi:uncharacterized protein YggT (Ycf19 family)
LNDFWSYWYFHLPNFLLAALMYTLLGRLILGLFVREDWDNYIWRFFKTVTDPFVRLVRYGTPDVIGHPVVLLFGVLWLLTVRFVYLAALINLGLGPVANPGA